MNATMPVLQLPPTTTDSLSAVNSPTATATSPQTSDFAGILHTATSGNAKPGRKAPTSVADPTAAGGTPLPASGNNPPPAAAPIAIPSGAAAAVPGGLTPTPTGPVAQVVADATTAAAPLPSGVTPGQTDSADLEPDDTNVDSLTAAAAAAKAATVLANNSSLGTVASASDVVAQTVKNAAVAGTPAEPDLGAPDVKAAVDSAATIATKAASAGAAQPAATTEADVGVATARTTGRLAATVRSTVATRSTPAKESSSAASATAGTSSSPWLATTGGIDDSGDDNAATNPPFAVAVDSGATGDGTASGVAAASESPALKSFAMSVSGAPGANTVGAASGVAAAAALTARATANEKATGLAATSDEIGVKQGATSAASAASDTFTLDPGAATLDASAATATSANNETSAMPTLKVNANVDSSEFSQGLADRVSFMVDNSLNGAKLQVNPAQLGPIELRISVQGDRAQVWMSSHSAVTREALQASTPKLQEMLGNQGFAQVSVDISQRSFQDRSAYSPPYSSGGSSEKNDYATASVTSTTMSTSLGARTGSGVVDAYA